jgi:hypothetical protein
MCITVFIRSLRPSISWARWTQSIASHPVSLRSASPLFSHPRPGLHTGLSLMTLPQHFYTHPSFPARAYIYCDKLPGYFSWKFWILRWDWKVASVNGHPPTYLSNWLSFSPTKWLTPPSKILLKKMRVAQLFSKSLTLHELWMFIIIPNNSPLDPILIQINPGRTLTISLRFTLIFYFRPCWCPLRILCFWTISIKLSLSKNTVFFIFQKKTFRRLDSVSVFRFQVKPEDGERVQSPKRFFLKNKQVGVLDKYRTMDNIQKHNICTNVHGHKILDLI